MTSNETLRLSNQAARRRIVSRIVAGVETMCNKRKLFIPFGLIILMGIVLFVERNTIIAATVPGYLVPMMVGCATLLIPVCVIYVVLGYMILIGTPRNARGISDNLHRAGVYNKLEEAPVLMHKYQDTNNPRITVLDFKSTGISRTAWENVQAEIEDALNCYVVKIREGAYRNRIQLHIVTSNDNLPERFIWTEEHAINDGSTLVLGQTVAGTDVTVNLSNVPHALIGGATGSGKSVLLKHLLFQCISDNMVVYIADFKGGVDFGHYWQQHAILILEENTLIATLKEIVEMIAEWKQVFRGAGVANISEFNSQSGQQMKRIVFACDEVAELFR